MSNIDIESLKRTFPFALSGDENQTALATSTANELVKLINNLDLLTIYNRIDTLDEKLLDILAYDFKVDWWNRTGSVEEKRQLLKEHWKIHKILGTPEALKLAFETVFDDAELKPWNEYGGFPYHYKLFVESGERTPDYEKLNNLVERLKYYSNVRSKFDGASFNTEKQAKIYYGSALQNGASLTATIAAIDPTSLTWYIDELQNDLVDENGLLLFD